MAYLGGTEFGFGLGELDGSFGRVDVGNASCAFGLGLRFFGLGLGGIELLGGDRLDLLAHLFPGFLGEAFAIIGIDEFVLSRRVGGVAL